MTNKEIFMAIDYCYAQLHPAVSSNGSEPKKVVVSEDNLERIEQTLIQLLEECVIRGRDNTSPAIAGYIVQKIEDNGDTDEWWRECHLESPIYSSREACIEAIQLVMNSKLKQREIELKEQGRKKRYIDFELKEIKERFSNAEITPVLVYDDPTDKYIEFNIGD